MKERNEIIYEALDDSLRNSIRHDIDSIVTNCMFIGLDTGEINSQVEGWANGMKLRIIKKTTHDYASWRRQIIMGEKTKREILNDEFGMLASGEDAVLILCDFDKCDYLDVGSMLQLKKPINKAGASVKNLLRNVIDEKMIPSVNSGGEWINLKGLKFVITTSSSSGGFDQGLLIRMGGKIRLSLTDLGWTMCDEQLPEDWKDVEIMKENECITVACYHSEEDTWYIEGRDGGNFPYPLPKGETVLAWREWE